MYVDPYWIGWLLITAASACAFVIGYLYNNNTKDEIINNTILYLISHNYVKGELINGEWDIIPLDEEK